MDVGNVDPNDQTEITVKQLKPDVKGAPEVAKSLYDTLRQSISSSNDIEITFTRGNKLEITDDETVLFGSFQRSRIDLDDMEALGYDTPGYNAGAALVHELYEQFLFQGKGVSQFPAAHAGAIKEEEKVVGAKRVEDSWEEEIASGATKTKGRRRNRPCPNASVPQPAVSASCGR